MEADLLVSGDDLDIERGLQSAVYISLFTDARASDGDALPDSNSTDKRGFWGDLVSPIVQGDQTGSLLWLLERSKTEPNVLIQAKRYAEECLQWMIEDGVATDIEVETERQGIPGSDILAIKVMIYRKSGEAIAMDFEYNWQGQFDLL
jgi:phage gp46-like protein